jgi:hypothetical protein
MALLSHRGAGLCPVCGGGCKAFPDVEHRSDYPFLPGGRDPVDSRYVIAPHRVVDHELERVMSGTGERVPIADALKYGLVAKPTEPAPEPRPKGKRRPAEDRARRLEEDR